MEFTGERFIPTLPGDIRLEHFHRYHWCRSLAKGKRVLDIASGEGYGSNLLAAVAKNVIGVDISPEAVAHAQSVYAETTNLSFLQGGAAKIPLPDNAVDLVVSFETIEHHTQHEEMIAEIKRVLTDDGVVVISSPNKAIYSDLAGGNHNHFHVKELYFSELDALLRRHFSSVRYLGQRATATSLLQPIKPQVVERFATIYTETTGGIEERLPSNVEAMYYVAIATNTTQPYAPESTAYFSELDNALQERTLEVMKLGAEIRRMSDYTAEVSCVLAARDQELAVTKCVLAARDQELAEAHAILACRDAELHNIKASFLWKVYRLIAKVRA